MSKNYSRGGLLLKEGRHGLAASAIDPEPLYLQCKSAENRGSGIHACKPRELLEQGSLSAFIKAHDAVGERSKVELDETIVE